MYVNLILTTSTSYLNQTLCLKTSNSCPSHQEPLRNRLESTYDTFILQNRDLPLSHIFSFVVITTMSSHVEDYEPECNYCGLDCGGECDDPDRCPTCWMAEYIGDYDRHACLDQDHPDRQCECECHYKDGMIGALRDLFDEFDGDEEMEALWREGTTPRLQPGTFPFLRLPRELRDKIYHYNMSQYGSRRKCPYFRGNIEVALLSTCRQINQEARHLPLSINTLSFSDSFQAYRFLGFGVLPSQRQLVKSVHVDVHGIGDLHGIFRQYLMPQLAKLMLRHFAITLQGRIEAKWFTEFNCLETCLLEVKGLASFDLVIGSGVINDVKSKIVETIRRKLVEAPVAAQNPLKRKASDDILVEDAAIPARGSRKVATTKSKKIAGWKVKTKKHSTSEITAVQEQESVSGLIKKYDRLKEYACTYDPEATSVKIRLGRAYEAASEGNDQEFETLAEDILRTLDAHLAKMVASRTLVPYQSSFPLQ